MLQIINENAFLIARIVLFFVATLYIFKALQAINLNKIFKQNSADSIRFIFMVVAIILGYLFVDAIISLFEYLNQLL
ncbi:MAG: DUF1146 family protein [Candidatus Izimaplasma sp.]|nr:DUF1146 family protein [Candidatus Izimaplasma bacterium]